MIFGNLRLWLIWGLALLVLLTACTTTPEPSSSLCIYPDYNVRPVIQITRGSGGVFVISGDRPGITDVTLWEDGRAVFVADGKFLEAQLEASLVDRLVDAAVFLYELDDSISLYPIVSLPATWFTVESVLGNRKTVEVYGMTLEGEWPPESDFFYTSQLNTVEKLRDLWQVVKDSLPVNAPIMQPGEVTVKAYPYYIQELRSEDFPEWPLELEGYLQGEAAKEAIQLAGIGAERSYTERLYRVDGEVHVVEVVPVLPSLHEIRWRWEFPRHPEATRYNISDPSYGSVYLFSGISQEEMVSWYEVAMADQGWNLVKEEELSLQVWVSLRYGGAIVELRFCPNNLFRKQIYVENDVPRYPGGILGGCEGSWCQLLKDITLEEAQAWFNEYMGYLGWFEESPNIYFRMDDEVKKLLKLGFRAEGDEIAVTTEEQRQIPPAWWPSPVDTLHPTPTNKVL